MGADLYIRSLHNKQAEVWKSCFEEAVRERDKYQRDTAEYDEAQKRVSECYDRLYECGYFRDPYNDWDVLWRFGLSWWNDIVPLLNRENCLAVADVRRLLSMLDEHQGEFQGNMAECSPGDREYFENQAKALREFLNQAIELNEPIACSL